MKLRLFLSLFLMIGMVSGLVAGDDAEQNIESLEEQFPGKVLTPDEVMAVFGNATWDYRIPDELRKSLYGNSSEEKKARINNSIADSLENLSSQNVSVKSDAVRKLVDMYPSSVAPLIQALENDNPDIRENSALALGKIGDNKAIGPLLELAGDENPEVSYAAEIALGDMGKASILWNMEEENIEYLVTHARNGTKSVSSRQVAVRTLGEYRQKAVSSLIQLLSDEDYLILHSDVRYALYRIGEPAVEPLITLLESDDSGVKSRAIESLGDIGDERAIGPLGFSLNDESEQVRQLAQTALEKIENPKVKTPSSGLYGQDPAFNITEEWGMEFVDMDIENTSMPAISYPYYAIYGKRSNFYIEDERREYLDKLRIIGNASMTEIEKYVQPQGPVYSYEYSYNGYISVGMATDSGVNESLMNEIYDIFDQHAQEIGIENIPVIFEYGNNEIAGDVDNEPDSRKACGFTVFLLVIVITLIYGTSHK